MTEATGATVDAVFTLSLDAPSGRELAIDYATADGSALTGEDYTSASGTVTFPAGTTVQTVMIAVLGDSKDEPN